MNIIKKSSNGSSGHSNSNKQWIHPAEALQLGHVAYLVKFLGSTEVDQPKGIDAVKEAIRKVNFNEHLKRAEGAKSPKVELTVSIDGVAIQEVKGSKKIIHQFPLHRISYCADDKTDKKFFSFIAKATDPERHECFVFVSDKLAEEITLTIGQAFHLAYRRFLETSGRDLEMRRQIKLLEKRVQDLECENQTLKAKVAEYESSKANRRKKSESSDILLIGDNGNISMPPPLPPPPAPTVLRNGPTTATTNNTTTTGSNGPTSNSDPFGMISFCEMDSIEPWDIMGQQENQANLLN